MILAYCYNTAISFNESWQISQDVVPLTKECSVAFNKDGQVNHDAVPLTKECSIWFYKGCPLTKECPIWFYNQAAYLCSPQGVRSLVS